MQECWHPDPTKRPTANEILERIDTIKTIEEHINTDILLNLLIIDICSYFSNIIDVVIPFNLIMHPTWLIDYSINFCIKNG